MGVAVFLRGLWPPRNYYRKPPTVRMFFARVVFDYALENPELLSFARILERFGVHFHNARLTDASPWFRIMQNRRFTRDLKILRSYHLDGLSDADRLSARIMEWYLDTESRRAEFLFNDYPVNQLVGIHQELPNFMVTIHEIHDARDARHYIRRLAGFKRKVKQVMRALRIREKRGVIPPTFVLDRVLLDMQKFLDTPPEEQPMYQSLKSKLGGIQHIRPLLVRALTRRAYREIRYTVYPAFRQLCEGLGELRKKSTDDAGVWKLPNGERYYRHLLRKHATVDLDPGEVHNCGLEEVTRIEEEVEQVLIDMGYRMKGKSIGDLWPELMTDPRYFYPDTPEGRAQCLDDYEEVITDANQRLKDLFEIVPDSPVVVMRLPKHKEETAPGGFYEPPAFGGDRPGVFWVNLRDMTQKAKFGMRTLAYHETIPGHHLQVARQMALKGTPFFRTIVPFTGYVEGWALYAERLVWEQGWYTDPYANLGRLQSELLRAARLVVDTGIHFHRWTREEAVRYMVDHAGVPEDEAITEIDRYIVDPGQSCAYKIGELRILELRKKAREALGDKFDLKAFHEWIVGSGPMPLHLLEELVMEKLNNDEPRGEVAAGDPLEAAV